MIDLFTHEKRLLEDDEYREEWVKEEINKSVKWFVDQLNLEALEDE